MDARGIPPITLPSIVLARCLQSMIVPSFQARSREHRASAFYHSTKRNGADGSIRNESEGSEEIMIGKRRVVEEGSALF